MRRTIPAAFAAPLKIIRTRAVAAVVVIALVAISGACSADGPTEAAHAPVAPSFSGGDTIPAVPPPPASATQGDTLCRGGVYVGGGGRACAEN
jgi:hypothetical protein